jgi:hypothetical protein
MGGGPANGNGAEPARSARGVGIFLLRFIAASTALYFLYIWAGIHYMKVVAYGAKPPLALFGYEMVLSQALKVTEEISLNPVVYLSLVIALPGVAVKRRIIAAVAGTAILTLLNTATVFLAFMSYYRESEQLWTGTEFLNLTINFFAPIVLWVLFMPVIETLRLRDA